MPEPTERLLIVDIENDDDRLLSTSWGWSDEEPVQTLVPGGPGWDELLKLWTDPSIPKGMWSDYDERWPRLHGIPVAGALYNGMVMAYLMNENTPLGLEWCAKRYIQEPMDKRIRSSGGRPVFKRDDDVEVPLGEAPIDQVLLYNGRDVATTRRLINRLRLRLHETGWWDYYIAEHLHFSKVLVDMECRGLPVDLVASEEFREELEVLAEDLRVKLLADAGLPESFNLNSGPQLSQYLFRKVFELTDALEPGKLEPYVEEPCIGCDGPEGCELADCPWRSPKYRNYTMEALKSCESGEHDDCFAWADGNEIWDGAEGDVCVMAMLPYGYNVEKLGRTQVHGFWTLRGRGLGYTIMTPSGDRPSTSSPALLCNLQAATDPWVTDLLRYRKMTKVLTTYLRKFPLVAREGRVYGRFNQTGTVTGRLSSAEPNLQNIPAHGELGPRIRNLFRAPEGKLLLVGDYSQLEPRLMAHYSQDPVMLEVYNDGLDFYLRTAAGIWGEDIDKHDPRRGIAKTYCLAMGYGAGLRKLQQILTINGYPLPMGEVEWQYGKLTDLYRVFFSWREATIASARRQGYVKTIAGQHRRLSAQFKSDTWKARGYGERQAVNAVIQGSAGDIVRRAMLAFDRFPDLALLAQVHDELVWEVRDDYVVDLDYVAHLAAQPGLDFGLSVPLVFEPHVGKTWYEAKEGSTFVLPEDYAGAFEDEDAEMEEADA